MSDLRSEFREWVETADLAPAVREAARDLLAALGDPDAVRVGGDDVDRLRDLERADEVSFWREVETVDSDIAAKLAAGRSFDTIPEVAVLRGLGFHPDEATFRRTV